MYIHRELEDKIQPFLKRKEILVIVGPRQAGKTTFLEYLKKVLEEKGKKVKFITFEKRENLALFQENLEDFKDLYSGYEIVIIDEFQYAKDGGQKLKYLYDTTKTKYIISGSSSLELTFQTGKYLVGRMFKFILLPFSFREYLSFADKELYDLLCKRNLGLTRFKPSDAFGDVINQRLERQFERYLVYGGYPSVVLTREDKIKQKILESILDNYLLKDIRSLLQLATEDELVRLVKFLSAQIGNLVEYGELSNSSGLNYKNLLKHLEILKQTYIIDFVKPFFTNRRTELTKIPKVYFIDMGLRNYALLDFRPASLREDIGGLAENYAFTFLKKQEDIFKEMHFWRTKSKAEVDFVIKEKNEIVPIEVRYSKRPVIGKSLHSFIEKFTPKKAIVLTKGYNDRKKVGNSWVIFLPIYYL